MSPKRIYSAFSVFQFFWTLLLRGAAAFGLVYAIIHYKENPIAVGIACFICIVCILFIGENHIVVYDDRILERTNSLWSIISGSGGSAYKFEEIETAYLPPAPGADEVAAGLFLMSVLPDDTKDDVGNSLILLKLKNDNIVRIISDISSRKRKTIVNLVNERIKQK